jgi:hypothetical protein
MASRPLSQRLPALPFVGAIITSLPVLWFFALSFLSASDAAPHVSHEATFYLHVIGGVSVILAGGLHSNRHALPKLGFIIPERGPLGTSLGSGVR